MHGDLCKHLGIDSSTDHPDRYSNLFLNAYINRHVLSSWLSCVWCFCHFPIQCPVSVVVIIIQCDKGKVPWSRESGTHIKPHNYQVSKEEVDKLIWRCSWHANIDNLQYSDRYFNTDWQFGMFKRSQRLWTWYLENVNFQIIMRQFQCVPQNNICLFNKWVFHHKLFLNKFSTTFVYSKKLACRNEQLSCSLLCTWMTIINYLFCASGSLSWDVSWEYIAKSHADVYSKARV